MFLRTTIVEKYRIKATKNIWTYVFFFFLFKQINMHIKFMLFNIIEFLEYQNIEIRTDKLTLFVAA